MKVCVYGAGAIGGYMGVQLALAGAEVSLIARGPHLAAMQANGVKLRIKNAEGVEEERVAKIKATNDPKEVGVVDVVIIALKGNAIPNIIDAMKPLLGPDTMIIPAVNGIPYWYFYKHGGKLENTILETIDPEGRQWKELGPERAIGCIVYPAAEVVEPGVIQHIYGNKFPLGEPSDEETPRLKALKELFVKADLDPSLRPGVAIRDELWLKLWGNLCFNPISALTHATLDIIGTNPGTRAVSKAMMLEGQAIGEKLGVKFHVDVERRINGAVKVGAHKTSMLQDLERGRPMEIDPLVTVVQEMGRLAEVPTPTIDVVLPLIQLRQYMADHPAKDH